MYIDAALGDLDSNGSPEILVSLGSGFSNGGALASYDRWGSLQWVTWFEGGAAPPALVDLGPGHDGAVFVSHGNAQELFAHDGSLLWTASAPGPTPRPALAPMAIDLDGDGVQDVVQTTHADQAVVGGNALLEAFSAPWVFGLDGTDGKTMFAEQLPCGSYALAPVAVARNDGILLVTACTWVAGPGEGAVVRAFEIAPHSDPLRALLAGMGILSPVRVEHAWDHEVQADPAHVWAIARADVVEPMGSKEIVVVAHNEGGTHIVLLDEDGHVLENVVDPQHPRQVTRLAAGDLDGDGLDDLVIAYAGGPLVAHGWRSGSLEKRWSVEEVPPGADPPASPGSFTVADLDGDGTVEVLHVWQDAWGPSTGHLVIRDGDGTLVDAYDFPRPFPDAQWPDTILPAAGPLVGDLTGDGAPELVIPAAAEVVVLTTLV